MQLKKWLHSHYITYCDCRSLRYFSAAELELGLVVGSFLEINDWRARWTNPGPGSDSRLDPDGPDF